MTYIVLKAPLNSNQPTIMKIIVKYYKCFIHHLLTILFEYMCWLVATVRLYMCYVTIKAGSQQIAITYYRQICNNVNLAFKIHHWKYKLSKTATSVLTLLNKYTFFQRWCDQFLLKKVFDKLFLGIPFSKI